MSLLQKASIITTPTAYAEDYLYSIKPAYQIGANEVANGDMELDCCWANYASATVTNERSTEEVHSGSYSRKYVTSGGTGGIQSNYFTTSTGKTYNLTFWVYPSTGTVQRIAVRRGDNGAWSIDNTFTGLTQNAWNKCTFTYTEAVGGATAYIAFHSNSATGTWYIDDVSINGITDADFDFDRNSTGTRVNEDYLIEDVPYNLLTYSEDFSVWSKEATVTLTANYGLAPDGTQTSTRMQMDANDSIYRSASSGNTFSIYIKGTAGETIRVANGTTITHTLTGRWDRVSVHDSGGSSTQVTLNTYSSATARDIEIWGAQLVKGDQPKDYLKTTDRLDIPRIDYTNGEPSILLEPSRTNTITYSEDFENEWSFQTGIDVSGNEATSPDGNTNATKIETTAAGSRYVGNNYTLATGGNTFSVFAKKGSTNWVYLNVIQDGSNNWNYTFDLENGILGQSNSSAYTVTPKIEDYGNGWYRCSISANVTSSGVFTARVYPADSATDVSTSIGDNIYIYGAQLEAGSYATSLIHTSGSAVTRSAETLNNAGNSDLFNDSEGVLFAEVKGLEEIPSDNGYITISSPAISFTNAAILQFRNNGDLRFYFGGSSSANIQFIVSDINLSDNNKIAVQYDSVGSNYKLFVNGVSISRNSGATNQSVSGLSELNLNYSSLALIGNVKTVAVFKEALSDTELACLTSTNNREIFLNYYNRMQYVNATTEAMGCAQKTYTI